MRQRFIFFFLLLNYAQAVLAQSDFLTQATASLNLSGGDRKVNRDSKQTISAESSTDCMSAMVSVSPNCELKARAFSSECGNINSPDALGTWFSYFQLEGSNGEAIPLQFNFDISGTVKQQSTPTKECLSLSLATISMRMYSDKEEKSVFSQTQYQSGILIYNNQKNIDAVDSYATATPVISVSAKGSRYKLDKNIISSFLQFFDGLTDSQKNSVKETIPIFSGKSVPTIEWKGTTEKMSLETGQMINLLNLFDIGVKLKIPGTELNIGLTFDVDYNYKFKRSLGITASSSGFFNVALDASASSSICGSASADVDFSNTLKLTSVSLPDGYYNSKVDLSKLNVKIQNTNFPVHYSIPTGVSVEQENNFVIFPNPSKNELIIKTSKPEYINQYIITDMRGQILFSKEVNEKINSEVRINLMPSLSAGSYFINIISDKIHITKKFLVAH